MDPFWSVGFCLCAVGSGDFSPETALLAALAHGQTSCSVSCIIAMFLEVSEINRTSCPLLCCAGQQGMLFLQRRMVKYEMWHYRCGCSFSKVRRNPCPQLEQWGLCSSAAPAVSAESCSVRGELETNFESETLVVRSQTEALTFYTTEFSVTEGQLSVTRCDGIQILFKLTQGAPGL